MNYFLFHINNKEVENKSTFLIDEILHEFPMSEAKIINNFTLIVKMRPKKSSLNKIIKIISKFNINIDLTAIEYHDVFGKHFIDYSFYNPNSNLTSTNRIKYFQTNLFYRLFKSFSNLFVKMMNRKSSYIDCSKNEEIELEKIPLIKNQLLENNELQTLEIHVFSLKCSSCANNLQAALSKIKGKCPILGYTLGTKDVSVNFVTKIAYITYFSNITTPELLLSKIQSLNHVCVIGSHNKKELSVAFFKYFGNKNSFDCCSKNEQFEITYIRSKNDWHFFKVSYRKKQIGIRKIYECLKNKNSLIELSDYVEVFPSETFTETLIWRRMFIISSFFGIITMGVMVGTMIQEDMINFIIFPGLSFSNLLLFIFSTIVQILVGKRLYISAFKSISLGINMDFLICTATTLAYFYSCVILIIYIVREKDTSPHTFFETPGMLYMIVSLGRWIEAEGKQHTIKSIKRLMKPQKQIVTIILYDKGGENFTYMFDISKLRSKEIASEFIEENDYINVFQGMRIPADGIIDHIDGYALLNEAILTGESQPVQKKLLDEIFSGSINEGSGFQMMVTKTGEDCRIQQLTNCVQRALSKKIPISNIVNTVSKYFTPGICVLAILTFTLWMICFQHIPDLENKLKISSYIQFSFQASISVLCVACPCAIGLAIPLAIMISTGVAAKYGLFIKGGPPIQILYQVKKMVFDKTGTLTIGIPIVEFLVTTNGINFEENIKFIYNLVSNSNHVLSRAIKKFCEQKYNFLCKINLEVKEITGFGLEGYYGVNINRRVVKMGKEDLMKMNDVLISEKIKMDVSIPCTEGATVVYVSVNSLLWGYFIIRDEIRSDAYYTLHNLKLMNIKPVMLTGDRMETANYVAKKLEIDEYYYNKSPEEKCDIITDLTKYGKKVAMVGDGVNDIIAIARSTVGISMGSGSDITAETANVVIMSNNLYDILNLIVLSRGTMNTVIRNLVFSSVYNLLSVPIAAGCLKWAGIDIQPWIASIAMVVSSLS
ncbi:hypothetical protein HZS_2739, partial [Henneguya salminicola]